MASARKIHLTVEDTGIVEFKPQDEATAVKTSELLQENHDKHHIFFNKDGFHNHIVHQLLTLYGLGAPSSVIEKQYKDNASYQRQLQPAEDRVVEELGTPETYQKYLGKEKYYPDFLEFWKLAIEKLGWETVLMQHVFGGDERADDLLKRLFAGFYHPLIHLGFGIEFKQPAIIAEALAQACVHDTWTGDYLIKAEKAAKTNTSSTSKTMVELLDEIYADKKLSTAAEWKDGNKIRDGILLRAPQEMIDIATKWIVTPENLEEKTVENINTSIYFTAAAQNPPKQVKFDFYYMHCVNTSIFFPTFNALPFLSPENKVRLLTWKGYLDLAMYASRRSPLLHLEEISLYTPKLLEAGDAEWPGIFNRLFAHNDDGHAIKLARAVRNGELLSRQYEEREWCKIKGFMWEKVGNMVVDSVEDEGSTWVRSAGFQEAWEEFKDRPRRDELVVDGGGAYENC